MRRKVFFATLTVTGALVLIEGAARLSEAYSPASIPASELRRAHIDTEWLDRLDDELSIAEPGDGLYVPDARLFWRMRRGAWLQPAITPVANPATPGRWAVKINGDGYRGPEYPSPKQNAAPVIAALGDGVTFGLLAREEDTYPAQLQAFLREQGLGRAVAINFGVPGYSSFQGRRQLDEILSAHRPDFVILAFGLTDMGTDRRSDKDKASRADGWRFKTYELVARSATGRLFLGPPTSQPGGLDATTGRLRVPPDAFRDNLRAMVQRARGLEARVILLDLVSDAPPMGEATAALARELQVRHIRVSPRALESQMKRDGPHPKYYGSPFYRELARAVGEQILTERR